ncbi:hypothetical protein HIM_00573 [Hirsutella minnesotensis 3608]|nr:hypothetical protein HIM_00573 [Hirsutella minnesotensis 3608]
MARRLPWKPAASKPAPQSPSHSSPRVKPRTESPAPAKPSTPASAARKRQRVAEPLGESPFTTRLPSIASRVWLQLACLSKDLTRRQVSSSAFAALRRRRLQNPRRKSKPPLRRRIIPTTQTMASTATISDSGFFWSRFMVPDDDRYRMVEDEFLHTAQRFTTHLHRAEYSRLKALARSHHASTISEMARPVVGSPTVAARLRDGTVRRNARDRRARSRDDARRSGLPASLRRLDRPASKCACPHARGESQLNDTQSTI